MIKPIIHLNKLPPKQNYGTAAIDLEVFGLDQTQLHRPRGSLACITICPDGKNVYVIEKPAMAEKALSRVQNTVWTWHHAGFDVPQTRGMIADIDDRPVDKWWDTFLMEKVLFAGKYDNGEFSLSDLTRRYLSQRLVKDTRKSFFERSELTNIMILYAALDCQATWHIQQAQEPILLADSQTKRVWDEIDAPCFWALQKLIENGVKLNSKKWLTMAHFFDNEAERIKGELGFNPGSKQQTQEALRKLGLYVDSTAEPVIAQYQDQYPIIREILSYREAKKAASTYGESFLKYVEADGRVRGNYNVITAVTGRPSSYEPNMQNLPRSKEFRGCFEAESNYVLVKADYSAQEPRITAALSQDMVMINAFLDGEDIHLTTARAIYSDPHMQKSDPRRQQGKTVFLATEYGLMAETLSQRQHIPLEDAELFIKRLKNTYRGMTAWIPRQQARVRTDGYTRTIFGRRAEVSPWQWGHANNCAINYPIQGGGADSIKMALVLLYKETGRDKFPAVLTVHDEIVIEVPRKDGKRWAKKISEIMLESFELTVGTIVPGEVEVQVAKTWAG